MENLDREHDQDPANSVSVCASLGKSEGGSASDFPSSTLAGFLDSPVRLDLGSPSVPCRWLRPWRVAPGKNSPA